MGYWHELEMIYARGPSTPAGEVVRLSSLTMDESKLLALDTSLPRLLSGDMAAGRGHERTDMSLA
jgi:hypothetical protein